METENYYIINTKLAQILVQNKGLCAPRGKTREDYIFDFSVTPAKRPVYTKALLFANDMSSGDDDLNLTPYDMAVADALNTVWMSGNPSKFTIGKIHHIMSGYRSNSLSQDKRAKIKESISKLERISIIIDCTDEMDHRKFKGYNIIGGPFLSLRRTTKSDLKPVAESSDRHFIIGKMMPLHNYANVLSQTIVIEKDVLAIDDGLQSSDTVILLRRELYRQISLMKNANNNYTTNDIFYSYKGKGGQHKGLIASLGYTDIDDVNRSLISDIHVKTIKILDALKTSINGRRPFIVDYQVISPEGRPVGVKIDCGAKESKKRDL